jgi:hypothetical protein
MTMSKTLKIAIISFMMLGTASTAMARVFPQPHGPAYFACQTDEGQGRHDVCDGGGA